MVQPLLLGQHLVTLKHCCTQLPGLLLLSLHLLLPINLLLCRLLCLLPLCTAWQGADNSQPLLLSSGFQQVKFVCRCGIARCCLGQGRLLLQVFRKEPLLLLPKRVAARRRSTQSTASLLLLLLLWQRRWVQQLLPLLLLLLPLLLLLLLLLLPLLLPLLLLCLTVLPPALKPL